MMNWIKKIWKDPVGATLISTGLLALIGWIGVKLYDGLVVSTLQTLWTWIKAFLFFEIAVIWIILGLAVLILILYLWVRLSDKSSPQEESPIPAFFSYTSDVFNGYTYEWGYCQNYPYDNYIIDRDSMRILCPKCDTAIYDLGYPSCPRCNNYNFQRMKDQREVILVIEDNIRRRKYDTK